MPVIFSVSFRDPGGYFLATRTMMRNQDVIYVANAPSVEVGKFLNFINLGFGTSTTVTTAIAAAKAIR